MEAVAVNFSIIIWLICSLPLSCLDLSYATARTVRIERGHAGAVSLYKQLLHENPTDVTAASRLAAHSQIPKLEETVMSYSENESKSLSNFLLSANYTNEHVQRLFLRRSSTDLGCCPLFVAPSAAGETNKLPFGANPSAIEVLASFFLLGLCISRNIVEKTLEPAHLRLLEQHFLIPCEVNPSLLVPLVQITPLQIIDRNLLIVTDWHPRVGATTKMTETDDAVMYVGPDSVALIQHAILQLGYQGKLLDLCTGSGVQALAALSSGVASSAMCVDVNPRALAFCCFNARLNGFHGQIKTVHGSILDDVLIDQLIKEGPVDMVTVNPPFLPVPEKLRSKFGQFSFADSTGEAVGRASMRLSRDMLYSSGIMVMVSEFFEKTDDPSSMLRRIEQQDGRALLVTNEMPISSSDYARRRSDNDNDYEIWLKHWMELDISGCSPGLLFWQPGCKVRRGWSHVLVPGPGSLWTPTNSEAIAFTRRQIQQYFSASINCK